jgi:hypothetical protein
MKPQDSVFRLRVFGFSCKCFELILDLRVARIQQTVFFNNWKRAHALTRSPGLIQF